MSNQKRIAQIFREVFLIPSGNALEDLDMMNLDTWNSVEHFIFISRLEETFNIHLKDEDILRMTSYRSVLEILEWYGI